MKLNILLISALLLALAHGNLAMAQDYYGQQDRALYAGAYFSMSFGDIRKSAHHPVRYGFSAGFRQQNFGVNDRLSNHSLVRNDRHLGFAGYGNIDARVFDLNFSDRGFEKISFAGLAFVEKDTFGQMQHLGRSGALSADGDDENGGAGKALLWTGVAVGVAIGIVAIARFGPGG